MKSVFIYLCIFKVIISLNSSSGKRLNRMNFHHISLTNAVHSNTILCGTENELNVLNLYFYYFMLYRVCTMSETIEYKDNWYLEKEEIKWYTHCLYYRMNGLCTEQMMPMNGINILFISYGWAENITFDRHFVKW